MLLAAQQGAYHSASQPFDDSDESEVDPAEVFLGH